MEPKASLLCSQKPTNIWWNVQTVKLPITQFYLDPMYFLLGPNNILSTLKMYYFVAKGAWN